jgi:hypothetical protein
MRSLKNKTWLSGKKEYIGFRYDFKGLANALKASLMSKLSLGLRGFGVKWLKIDVKWSFITQAWLWRRELLELNFLFLERLPKENLKKCIFVNPRNPLGLKPITRLRGSKISVRYLKRLFHLENFILRSLRNLFFDNAGRGRKSLKTFDFENIALEIRNDLHFV